MYLILRKIIYKLRRYLLPTEYTNNVRKWLLVKGDETLRLNYKLDSNSLVMDLGGYKGQWCSDIYSRYNCRILVFEPVCEFAKNIEERFKNNSRIKVYCLALGGNSRRENIFLSDDGTSIYKSGIKKEAIQIEDVAEFFMQHNIRNVALMKINIEGGEYELLSRLIEKNIVERIDNLQIQFHKIDKNSERYMKKIQKQLSKTHSLTYQYKFVWENWSVRNACHT